MAEQKPLPTGWIEGGQWVAWSGGARPVPEEAVVFALHRNGSVNAGGLFARVIRWEWSSDSWATGYDVVAYYVVTMDVGTLTAAPYTSSVPPPPTCGVARADEKPKDE